MRYLFKKNKKGFTLVELVVTVALLTIVMTMIGGVMSIIFGDFHKTNEYVEGMNKAKSSAQLIAANIKKANFVCLSHADQMQYDVGKEMKVLLTQSIFAKDGMLYKRETLNSVPKLVFDETYWEKYSIDVDFYARKKEVVVSVIEIVVKITDKTTNKEVAVYKEAVEAVNADEIKFLLPPPIENPEAGTENGNEQNVTEKVAAQNSQEGNAAESGAQQPENEQIVLLKYVMFNLPAPEGVTDNNYYDDMIQ